MNRHQLRDDASLIQAALLNKRMGRVKAGTDMVLALVTVVICLGVALAGAVLFSSFKR